jgi:hypothetical protein
VFDARFLRNPHYDPMLRSRTGLDPEVGAYIREDQDYAAYLSRLIGMVDMVLPRFVHEGKKYATIAIGCTGGRHRSVYLVERLAAHLSSGLAAMRAAGENGLDWRQTVTHRELGLAGPDQFPTGLQAEAKAPLNGASQDGENEIGGPSSSVVNAAPDKTRIDIQTDGDGQQTAPIQAQEA